MKKLCKGKYKVTNWSEYNNSLKNRGEITFWLRGRCRKLERTGIKVLGEKEWVNYKQGIRQRKIWHKATELAMIVQ